MAINFPNSPVNGNTYTYSGIKYTYVDAGGGYWKVSTPGSVGIANAAEINAGTEAVKYVTPEELALSKYAGGAGIANTPAGNITAENVQDAIDQLEGMVGRKNVIINGNFNVWQRGNSFSAIDSDEYVADRWLHRRDGSGATVNVNQSTFALGQTDVPNSPKHYLTFNASVAGVGATYNNMQQRIEGVQTLSGKTVTLTFFAKAGSAYTVPISTTQNFGTGGSPSADVDKALGNVDLTTSWQKFKITTTLGSVSTKTLGTDGNDYLAVLIGMPTNQICTVDVAQVQLEEGALATGFEGRSIGEESSLCERYYQHEGYSDTDAFPVYNSTSVLARRGILRFRSRMRSVPTVTFSFLGSNWSSTPNIQDVSRTQANFSGTATSSNIRTVLYDWQADAEL